ncbi:MAG: TIGR01459 family HAD-type hydrolase [Alphaproteobacteria bacterium]|nr:TIGR01459 family HAD-type hydrolase [Alphaproteobacteria bacterium]
MNATRIVPGLAPLEERYDAYLVDLWGCLHDGVRPFPAALDALERLRAGGGKRVCFLSNGPRRIASLIRRLDDMGVPRSLYDAVMSSGESAWAALRHRDDPWHARLGRRCLHVGPERDNDVREGNGLDIVERVEDADFILCTGIDGWDETVADYEPLLAAGAARGLPMVCANPDLVVHIGEKLSLCAGSLAIRYVELGGDVAWHGKPDGAVFARALEALGSPDPARALMVGDGLRTDVAGGNAYGIDTLFLSRGIHEEEVGAPPDPARMEARSAELGVRPTWAMTALRW